VKAPIATLLAAVCLLLSLAVVVTGRSNQGRAKALQERQAELSRQQEEINKGNLSQQIGLNLVRAAAEVSVRNAQIRELLQRHGFTVTTEAAAETSR